MAKTILPETIYLTPKPYCPNSQFPALIYRDALPLPVTEASATTFLASHGWEKRGTWGHVARRHFHTNTHECYGVFQGESTLLLGCATNDDPSSGIQVHVDRGDVIVLPAGTGHSNVESSPDYRYIGVYPQKAPMWQTDNGKQRVQLDAMREALGRVETPDEDPVCGGTGPLQQLWKK